MKIFKTEGFSGPSEYFRLVNSWDSKILFRGLHIFVCKTVVYMKAELSCPKVEKVHYCISDT